MRGVATCLLVVLLAACTGEPATERHTFFALGTLVEISVFDPPPGFDDALRETEAALLEAEQRWRAWGDGELAQLNRQLANGETVQFSPPLKHGIERARRIARSSRGLFNPGMGNLVQAWGFHEEQRDELPPPGDDVLAELLPAPDLDALVETEDGWQSADERLWLDMGAFAKGLAVEAAVGVLRDHGVENAIVNAGGDLKTIGRYGERDWRIGVRHPRGEGVLAAIHVGGNESVFTSGNYERDFQWQGERFHHILDPATARPARGVASVTVVHPDAALADAAATALFVAGRDEWPRTARRMGIDTVLMVFDDGEISLTPAMQHRIAFEKPPDTLTVIAP